FWPGYGVASMASYNQYETIGAPCIQTKIRRNFGPIYYFRGPKTENKRDIFIYRLSDNVFGPAASGTRGNFTA
ncbi:MAG: hypothetical protein U9Q05_14835, partial [Thermodesulfobacteriota bacterium]|nr:hypothetical protein [Thermodesulfobacteriota bacterium]